MWVSEGLEAKCATPMLTFPLILRPMLSEQAARHGTCGSLASYLTEKQRQNRRATSRLNYQNLLINNQNTT